MKKLFDLGRYSINTVLEGGEWKNFEDLREYIDETIQTGRYSTKGFLEILLRGHMEINPRKKSDRVRAIEEILVATKNVKACEPLLAVFKSVMDSETRNAIIRIVSTIGDTRLDRALITIMKSDIKEFREAAACILKKTGSSETFDTLQTVILETTGWDSRIEAIDVLHALNPDRAIPVLGQVIALSVRGDVRAAILTLAKINTWPAQRIIMEAAKDESSRIRLWATEAMVEMNSQELQHVLLSLTADDNVKVVLTALEGIEKFGSKEAIQPVIQLLQHKSKDVCARSVMVLQKIGDDSCVPPLVDKLHDRDLTVRQAVMDALGHLGKLAAINTCKMLIDIMIDPDVNVRRCAIEIISVIGAHGVISELFHYIKDEDWWVREQVASTFCELKDHRIIEPVIELLKDPSTKIRRYAIEILNALPDPRSVRALLGALTDGDWWIRERSVEAIGYIKDPMTVPILIQLLKSQDLTWVTLRALGSIGDERAYKALLPFLTDHRDEIRIEALRTIGTLNKVKEAQPEIMKLLSDPLKAIRREAHELLGDLLDDIDTYAKAGELEWKKKYLSELDYYLLEVKGAGASDLFVAPNRRPMMKKHGDVQPIADKILTPLETKEMLLDICPPEIRTKFLELRDADFSYDIPGEGRFRVNMAIQRSGITAVFRVTPDKPPTISQLNLPEIVYHFTKLARGLVLVTGSIGSGKSTTLAALVDEINENRSEHIITIEDPIEYIHPHKKCIVNQRELGGDTLSFAAALRSALREDPDIILVGELRDLETISMAITAAETGHLVFGTLHTNNAAKTVDRIIDVFPTGQAGQVRTMLAESLAGVVSQQLVKKINGGMTAAMEILLATPALSKLIREGKTYQIPTIMITGAAKGMQSMDQALMKLFKNEIISIEEAYSKAVFKKDFEDFLTEDKRKELLLGKELSKLTPPVEEEIPSNG